MNKVSTLVYSINNLASKATNNIFDTEIFDTSSLFLDLENLLDSSSLYDVRQAVVDNILIEAARM